MKLLGSVSEVWALKLPPHSELLHCSIGTIVKALRPTTPKTRKRNEDDIAKEFSTQDHKNVALKLPKISLNEGYCCQFKGYILCLGDVGAQSGGFCFRGWKTGSRHRGFTITPTVAFNRLRGHSAVEKITGIDKILTARMLECAQPP